MEGYGGQGVASVPRPIWGTVEPGREQVHEGEDLPVPTTASVPGWPQCGRSPTAAPAQLQPGTGENSCVGCYAQVVTVAVVYRFLLQVPVLCSLHFRFLSIVWRQVLEGGTWTLLQLLLLVKLLPAAASLGPPPTCQLGTTATAERRVLLPVSASGWDHFGNVGGSTYRRGKSTCCIPVPCQTWHTTHMMPATCGWSRAEVALGAPPAPGSVGYSSSGRAVWQHRCTSDIHSCFWIHSCFCIVGWEWIVPLRTVLYIWTVLKRTIHICKTVRWYQTQMYVLARFRVKKAFQDRRLGPEQFPSRTQGWRPRQLQLIDYKTGWRFNPFEGLLHDWRKNLLCRFFTLNRACPCGVFYLFIFKPINIVF